LLIDGAKKYPVQTDLTFSQKPIQNLLIVCKLTGTDEISSTCQMTFGSIFIIQKPPNISSDRKPVNFYNLLHCVMLFIVNILRKGMIFFYPELIENRGGISILHHFKERLSLYSGERFCAKKRSLFLSFNSVQR
jgi:hypothetical protein